LYRDNRLDRGHLARRADLLWGIFQVPLTEIEQRARFRFPQALRDADLQLAPEEVAAPLISTTDPVGRPAEFDT
jgi:DNA/RNA endonuclease G (NUC1)